MNNENLRWELISVLQGNQLDQQDERTIKILYWNQVAVHFRREDTRRYLNTTNSETGKACDLSPLLFTYYSEVMFREALGCRGEGLNINGKVINIIIMPMTPLQLQEIDRVNGKYSLKSNCKKTKYMVLSKTPSVHPNFIIKSTLIERDNTKTQALRSTRIITKQS